MSTYKSSNEKDCFIVFHLNGFTLKLSKIKQIKFIKWAKHFDVNYIWHMYTANIYAFSNISLIIVAECGTH